MASNKISEEEVCIDGNNSENSLGQNLPVTRRSLMKVAGVTGASAFLSAQGSIAAANHERDGFDPLEATVAEVRTAITTERATAVEITETYLDRIEEYDDELNSILTLNSDAVDRAADLDAKFEESGLVGPLHGVPILLKDNFNTGDLPTTGGSVIFEDSVPPEDAFSVQQLRDAGGIILAKTNMHEFAYGGTTVSSLGGQTKNPYDLDRHSRGSSGGTASAVAANLGVIGIGSDTCSSIRGPSTVTSLVGLRPSIGTVSRDGVIPLSATEDTGGPMTRTVTDTAVTMDAIAGYDSSDPATSRGVENLPTGPDESFTDYLNVDGLEGARIGAARDFYEAAPGFGDPTNSDPEVVEVIDTALDDMEDLGAEIVDPVDTGELFDILLSIGLIQFELRRDMNAYLDNLDDPPVVNFTELVETEDYVPGIQDPLEAALEIDPDQLDENVEYLSRIADRNRVQDILLNTMAEEDLDAIVYPSEILPPGRIGSDDQNGGGNCTISAGSGFPAIAVPAGLTESDNLPVGVELLGRPFSEPLLIELAYSYEQGTMHRKQPEGYGEIE